MLECRNAYFHSPCNLGSELESAMESGEFEAAGLASLAEEQAEGVAGEGEVGSSGHQGAVFIAGSPVMGSSPVLGGR